MCGASNALTFVETVVSPKRSPDARYSFTFKTKGFGDPGAAGSTQAAANQPAGSTITLCFKFVLLVTTNGGWKIVPPSSLNLSITRFFVPCEAVTQLRMK